MAWKYDSKDPMDAKNAFINDKEFICDLIGYEMRKNGKCYKHDPASFLGSLGVKKRISNNEFEDRKKECLNAIMRYEESRPN